MKELLELSFAFQNLIPTIIFLFVIVYWLTVMLGAIDIGSLDVDLDLDVDVDIDVDVDADVDVDGASISWLNSILSFFNLGKIPFMVWLSFVAMPLWAGSIIINKILGNELFSISILIVIPLLILSMFLAKFATMPFVPIFKTLDKGSENINIPGKICKVILAPSNGKIGQAEIELDSNFILIYIYVENNIQLKKGDTALVIQQHDTKDYYLVEPYQI